MRYEDQRALLVKELSAQGIRDERVLEAFLEVKRELFVPEENRAYSYHNRALPIALKQTISQPLMIAIMLQLLDLKEDDLVLEIGTGSGYQTALLSHLVKEICSVELLEALSLTAQKILKEQGVRNAHFRIGDGAMGWVAAWPPHKEFDKIVVSAGAKNVPEKLTAQIKEGGAMVIPVGETSTQELLLIKRIEGKLLTQQYGLCSFVPLVTKE